MPKNSIGRLINQIREERGITQKKLCEGLCSVQTLSNIELGERMPDVFLLEYLLQRLGVSPDDFETVLFDDEYKEIERRDQIEAEIESGNLVEADKILEEHFADSNKDDIKHQYYYQIKAVLESVRGNHIEALKYTEKAFVCTHPKFKVGNKNDMLLSTKEIELLCMMADESMLIGDTDDAKIIVKYLVNYIKTNSIQDIELVKTFSKIAYLSACLAATKKEQIEGISQCESVFKLLIDCDSTVFLAEIMEILIENYRSMNLGNRVIHLENQLGSIKALYEKFGGCIYVTQSKMKWFKETYRKEYLLCKEMIRGERLARDVSRNELIEGIYQDPETLVRIECGNQNPSHNKYSLLMQRLGMPLEKYNSPPVSEEKEIYEIKKKIIDYFSIHDYEAARIELEKLSLKVESNDAITVQYLMRQNAMLEFELNQISPEAFCEKTVNALKKTYAGDLTELPRIPTQGEIEIFNYLAIAYWQMGEINKGISLYEKLLTAYANTSVIEKYHFRGLALLIRNYLRLLEESGETDKALEIAERELKLEILALRGGGMDIVASEIACVYEKMDLEENKKKKAVEKYLRHAFYLSDLFMRESDNKLYDNYYRANVNNDIKWYE